MKTSDVRDLFEAVTALRKRVIELEAERDACRGMEIAAERRGERLYEENQRLREELEAAKEKAATYEKDWREAKAEFGTATAKLREQLRASEESATRGWGVADSFHVTVSGLEAEIARLRSALEEVRSWASAEHVIEIKGKEVLLVDLCADALRNTE